MIIFAANLTSVKRRRSLLKGNYVTQVVYWEFSPFHFDVVNSRLYRGEQIIALPPKAFEVLRYLIEHRGSLVSKKELLEVVWQNRVGDDVLKGRITELRKALGDSPRSSHYIETVARRGYRFIAAAKPLWHQPILDVNDKFQSWPENFSFLHTGSAELYPDLLGEWQLDVEFEGRRYREWLHISIQRGPYFKGMLLTPHPNGNALIEQMLRGELIDKFHAMYTYHCKSNIVTECGTGILVIGMDHKTMTGKSVNIGFTAQSPSIAIFTAKKCSQGQDDENRASRTSPGMDANSRGLVV